MAERHFIFFDVGNTLLFPNRARMLEPLPAEKHPTLEAWQAIEIDVYEDVTDAIE